MKILYTNICIYKLYSLYKLNDFEIIINLVYINFAHFRFGIREIFNILILLVIGDLNLLKRIIRKVC